MQRNLRRHLTETVSWSVGRFRISLLLFLFLLCIDLATLFN